MVASLTSAELLRRLQRLHRARAKLLLAVAGVPHDYTPTSVTRRRTVRRQLGQALVQRVSDLHAKPRLKELVAERRSWFPKRGKGHRIDDRKTRFKAWYRGRIGPGPSVYLFWNGRRCLYIGRTERGGGRPAGHFDKHWFRSATRIDILVPHQRRHVASLECLAMHLYAPLKNKVRASRKPYRTQCPVCKRTSRMLREFDALV